MAKAPAFQFYASDFYVGTSHFSVGEVGLYVRGLAWSWDNGPLPLNDKVRAQVLLVTLGELRKLWPVVSAKWEKASDGYINHRLEIERQKQADYRAKQSQKGKASAASRGEQRLNHGSTTVQPEYQPRLQPDHQPEAQPNGNSSSSSSDFVKEEHRDTPSGSITETRQRYGAPLIPSPLSHRSHGWCCDRGLCLPQSLYDELLGRLGGPDFAQTFRNWLGLTIAALGPTVPGESVWVFWRSRFEAWQGSTTPSRTATTKPQPAYVMDWAEECEKLHGGACGGQYRHGLAMKAAQVCA